VSLAGTAECLAIRNRPGNVRSSDGTTEVLDVVLPRVEERGGQMLVRGDSDFDRGDVRAACDRAGAYSAFVGRDSRIDPSSSRRSANRSGSRFGLELTGPGARIPTRLHNDKVIEIGARSRCPPALPGRRTTWPTATLADTVGTQIAVSYAHGAA